MMERCNIYEKDVMEDINNKKDFIRNFAITYGYTQKDVRLFLSNLKEYLENAVTEGIELDINGILTLYYSYYPSRKAPPLKKGEKREYLKNEYIELEPIIRVRYRIPENLRVIQRKNSKIIAKGYEKKLEEMEDGYDRST
jgi:nucleoid DNA-binding protein